MAREQRQPTGKVYNSHSVSKAFNPQLCQQVSSGKRVLKYIDRV